MCHQSLVQSREPSLADTSTQSIARRKSLMAPVGRNSEVVRLKHNQVGAMQEHRELLNSDGILESEGQLDNPNIIKAQPN